MSDNVSQGIFELCFVFHIYFFTFELESIKSNIRKAFGIKTLLYSLCFDVE